MRGNGVATTKIAKPQRSGEQLPQAGSVDGRTLGRWVTKQHCSGGKPSAGDGEY